MSKNNAPQQQLMITAENANTIINRVYVKKKDIIDPRIIDNLQHLCNAAKVKNDPKRMLAIFNARKELLENASEIYAEQGEDQLFDEHVTELEVLIEILKEYTLQR